jgi:hypothetical protein
MYFAPAGSVNRRRCGCKPGFCAPRAQPWLTIGSAWVIILDDNLVQRSTISMKQLAEVTGLPLQWMQPSAWRETYELHAGDSLVRFDIGGFFRHSAQVAIESPALRLTELLLLITLGWYLAVMMHQDSSAAAVVVAA